MEFEGYANSGMKRSNVPATTAKPTDESKRKHFELDWVAIHLSFTVHWIRFCNITFVVSHMIHSIQAMSCHSLAVVCVVTGTLAVDGLPLELKKGNNNTTAATYRVIYQIRVET